MMKKYSPDVLLRWLFSTESLVVYAIGVSGVLLDGGFIPSEKWANCLHRWLLPGLEVVCKKSSASTFMTLWFTFLPITFLVLAHPWFHARHNEVFRKQVIASHLTFDLFQRRMIVYVLTPFFILFSWVVLMLIAIDPKFSLVFFGDSRLENLYCVLGSAAMLQLFCAGQFVAIEKFSFRKSIMGK